MKKITKKSMKYVAGIMKNNKASDMNHIEYNYLCSGYIFLKAMLTVFSVLKYRSLMQQFQRHYWDVLLLCNLDRHCIDV